jgi:hypothetical protein
MATVDLSPGNRAATASAAGPIPYFPRYYTPLAAAAVAEAEAADSPVPYTPDPAGRGRA